MRSRDYIPTREQNLDSRMAAGASLVDGLCGRTEAQKEGARYRRYVNSDGTFNSAKKWMGFMSAFSLMDDCCD